MKSPGESRLLCRGAEADIVEGNWQGAKAIFKIRNKLDYRLPALDEAIRRQRTIHEAEMIHSARMSGVDVPHIYYVDLPESTIVMEYAEGDRLKELVDTSPESEVARLFTAFGRATANLHNAGIMHGDLTTANVVRRNGGLVLLDFGLSVHSNKVEDHAVDLRLVKETVVGAHPGVAQRALKALFDGYGQTAGSARTRSVLRQLKSIERRGRYARVT